MNGHALAEQILRDLIKKHGLAEVQRQLDELIPNASIRAYFSAKALAKNVNNKLQRSKTR